mgnify:CR=1 FL=1
MAPPRAPLRSPELIERLDRLLPQTQCGQCGYDGCRPYAQAMARGEAGVDRAIEILSEQITRTMRLLAETV